MFEGSRAPRPRLLPAAAGRGRVAQRIDQRRSHQLLGSRADRRARARAVDGIGSHGLPAAGADRGEVREPARRRAERAAAELREPAVRPGADGDAGGALSARSSVSLDDDRRDRGSAGRAARRGARVLPALLPSGQRVARARRRHRSRRGARAGRARTSATSSPASRVEPVARRRGARRATCGIRFEDRVELPRLYLAWLTPAMFADGRRRARSGGRPARQRQDVAPLPAPRVRRADRDRRLGVAELARDGGLRRRSRRPRRRATRSPSSSARSSRRSRGSPPTGRPTTRSSAAACRPRRSSCSGCRRSAASAASRISSTPTTSSSATRRTSTRDLERYQVVHAGVAAGGGRALSRSRAPRDAQRRAARPRGARGARLGAGGRVVTRRPAAAVDRDRLPAPGPTRPFPFPAIEKSTLPNGLRVWTVRHTQVPLVAFTLLVRRGAARDPAGKEGLAAVTADMLDEGSGDRSAIEMHEALARHRRAARHRHRVRRDGRQRHRRSAASRERALAAARRHRRAPGAARATTSRACASCGCTG